MTEPTTVGSPPPQRASFASLYLIVHAPGLAQAVPFHDGDDLIAGRGQEVGLHMRHVRRSGPRRAVQPRPAPERTPGVVELSERRR